MAEIEIEIDGQKLTAQPNQTVIQVADAAGIYIPRFCYHKNLSIPANCRMCLVEIEKMAKPMPACATPAAPGMKVFTKSKKTIDAQRAVMEFLLINHPLDCPICDQGGECELQDLSMGYGSSWSHYDECKRAVADQDLGPLIATEMTRCILCTRCVRFGDEIGGIKELGAIGRGEFTEIGTYIQHCLKSEVSGNIIDLCPVGALTSKPYRFTGRAWELDQSSSISPHDCVGSNLNIHTRYGKLMRVVARENSEINETWISDRDRFSYTGTYHPDRLEEPRIRIDGEWQVVDWQQALEFAAAGLKEAIALHGADKFGGLASPNATVEEFYLFQKLVRGLDSPHVDHRLRASDTHDQSHFGPYPGLGMTLQALAASDTILLIGANIQKEQPIVNLYIRKASLNQAKVLAINAVDYEFNFNLSAKQIVAPHLMPDTLEKLSQALTSPSVQSNEFSGFIDALKAKKNVSILLGALAMHHPRASEIRKYAREIAKLTGGKIGFLTDGANSAGGYLAGAVPHRHTNGIEITPPGLSAHAMLEKPRDAYLLLNVEPELDCVNALQAKESFKHASFVLALSMYRNPILEETADVILPIAGFAETSGTYINALGHWQSFQGAATPFSEARPAWKILRVLANFLNLDGFDYESSESVRHEVKALVDTAQYSVSSDQETVPINKQHPKLSRIGEVPIYAVDSLVRRAKPLQEAQFVIEGDVNCVRLHPKTAADLQVSDGQQVRVKQKHGTVALPVTLDHRIAEQAIWVAGGIPAAATLGDLFGEIELEAV